MHTICVLLLSLGFEIGIGTTVKGTGALSYLSGTGKKKQLTLSGLTTVSSCCDHLLCKHTHNFYLVVWAFVLVCLSFSLTTWWKQYERLHYLIWFSASHRKIVHSWYSDCSDGSQAEPSWAEQITSLLVCLTQGQTTRGILLALSLLTSTQTSVNSSRWGWISNILVKMHSKQLVGSAHIDFWILLISILLRAFLV